MNNPSQKNSNARRRFLLAAAAAGAAASTPAASESEEVKRAPLTAEQRKLISTAKKHGSELGSAVALPSRSISRRW